MSFKRFETDDIIVSAESISSTVWSTDKAALTSFNILDAQVSSSAGAYYINVYAENSATASNQFSIAFGSETGKGSTRYNNAVAGKSTSSTIYGQFRSQLLGDEESNFTFGGFTAEEDAIFALTVERSRYKEKLIPGSFELHLSSSAGVVKLTDNSNDITTVSYSDSGRVYELVSGSSGTAYSGTGYSATSGSYGKLYPDVGIVVLNPFALQETLNVSYDLTSTTGSNTANAVQLFNEIKLGKYFKINSEETVSSNYVFLRIRNGEFNYSANPSFVDTVGDLYHTEMVNSPQSYITTVGLYNDDNDLLAVAKLSKPLLKDFTKEALIRVKLDY